jgi:hypothetical protein
MSASHTVHLILLHKFYSQAEMVPNFELQVIVFWVMILCNDEVRYQHFRGPCLLHPQGEVNSAGNRNTEIVRKYKKGWSPCRPTGSKKVQ